MLFIYLLACSSDPTPRPQDPPPQATATRLEILQKELPLQGFQKGAPNVVLLLGCTVRRDQVSSYGAPEEVTPFLTAMAAEGVRMADPIAAAPWTRAASTAILTAHHPLELGMVEAKAFRNDRALPRSATTAAELFQRAGYRTVGATANPNLSAIFGFDQGFQTYIQPKKLWRTDRTKMTGEDLFPELLKAVDKATDRPLFLQVMLVDAHAPFLVPDPEAFAEKGLPQEVQLYRAALNQLDEAVSVLHHDLEKLGYDRSNTVFVFVSDHGEGLSWPEHHGVSHGRYLYSSAVEAVWQMTGPSIPAGTVVEGVSSQIDVLPTLLGLAGVEAKTPGLDLSGVVRSGGHSPRKEAIADTWFRRSNRAAIYTTERVCMRSFKAPQDEPNAPTGAFVAGCYDRRQDPLQNTRLADLSAPLMEHLNRWRAERPLRVESPAIEISDDLDAQLEALGYTGK